MTFCIPVKIMQEYKKKQNKNAANQKTVPLGLQCVVRDVSKDR